MAWVTWRQHRAALVGVAVFLGALAVYLWLTGLQIHHSYATACHPASSLACNINFTGRYAVTVNVVRVLLQAAPALIGAFAGAPVLARELETGTFRYAWTQGIGRRRWTLGKLVPLMVTVAAAAGAFSALFSWYLRPFSAAGYAIPFATDVFDLREVAFAAWTLAAFAIGALAGMLIRRAVPAIAATLAAYAGLALATALYLRQHYMTPVTTSKLNLPGSAWIVSQWYTKGGKFAFPARGSQIVSAVSRLCPPRIGNSGISPAQCLTQHGYTQWASYQPGSRFWPFQWIEGGWLLALSVLLIAATVWLVRRRAT
jgi:ABC-type transport system involved in multi-copper enzyme maturation permease subunit